MCGQHQRVHGQTVVNTLNFCSTAASWYFFLQDYELLAGSRAMNNVAMCGQLQNSITACVYFLPPHHLKKVDLILISALSQVVSALIVVYVGEGDLRGLEGTRGGVLPASTPPDESNLILISALSQAVSVRAGRGGGS